MNVLEEFWYGNLDPAEYDANPSKEYKELVQLISRNTELTYRNGDVEFRPDIILLLNGMPLSFVEVKKPNNKDGIIAEHNRINSRFSRKVFRRFEILPS